MATEDQCGSCGERNPAGSAFCVFCGTYLGWEQPGQGPAPSSPAPPPPQPTVTPVTESAPPPPQPASPQPPSPTARPGTPPLGSTTSLGAPCPNCGQENPPTRRFCSRCGHQLIAATLAAPTQSRPASEPDRWDPGARAARREYRRSLPALYRWRRVLVGLAVLAVVLIVLALTGNDPVGWAQEKWRDLTSDLEPVENVSASAFPKGTVAPTYDVRKIPGPRQAAWATSWPANASGTRTCGRGPAEGAIVLRWDEPTRVRGLDVWAGLDADSPDRARQPRPKLLAVSYADQCVQLELEDTPDRQTVSFDTGTEVDTLLVKVDDVYPSDATPPEDLVAIGGIEVLHQAG